jgi:16S rRNA (guanine966-N2)-methyltransferase
VTRIIAGAARGRRLVVPTGRATRPTSDRAREGLFSTVEALMGTLSGAAVMDLYAGSGAVGLEAASRGAERVLLAESDPRALRAIRANSASLGSTGVEVHSGPVERLVAGNPAAGPYGLAFLDPPYDVDGRTVSSVLDALLRHGWLGPRAVVVIERATRDAEWVWPAGFTALQARRYGEATLWYGRAS